MYLHIVSVWKTLQSISINANWWCLGEQKITVEQFDSQPTEQRNKLTQRARGCSYLQHHMNHHNIPLTAHDAKQYQYNDP